MSKLRFRERLFVQNHTGWLELLLLIGTFSNRLQSFGTWRDHRFLRKDSCDSEVQQYYSAWPSVNNYSDDHFSLGGKSYDLLSKLAALLQAWYRVLLLGPCSALRKNRFEDRISREIYCIILHSRKERQMAQGGCTKGAKKGWSMDAEQEKWEHSHDCLTGICLICVPASWWTWWFLPTVHCWGPGWGPAGWQLDG